MSTRTSFGDGLVSLDMRETRQRLAEAMAAVKTHPSWSEGSKGKLLQDAFSAVERELLTSARGAIQRLDAALRAVDFKPNPDPLPDAPKLLRDLGIGHLPVERQSQSAPATLAEAHADIVAGLDADSPPPPVRQSPPPAPLGGRRVQVPPPRPRLPPRP